MILGWYRQPIPALRRRARTCKAGQPESAWQSSVIQLRAGQPATLATELALISSHGQHLSVRKQRGRVCLARGVETRCIAEIPARRIVQLRTRDRAEMIAGNDQNFSVAEEMRRVKYARSIQTPGNGECSPARVVQFRACKVATIGSVILSSRQQDVAVPQYGCCLRGACRVQASGERESSGRRVIQFGACQVMRHLIRASAGLVDATCNQNLSIAQQR
jgi:hypothetical protein